MTKPTLLEQHSPLGVRYALLVLLAFFFFLPSAFRAARLSLGQKENDVKDWLPSDFPETAELEWFADHFAGESFVLATWPGCTSDDQRLTLLENKLVHESDQYDPATDFPEDLAISLRRAREVGNELQLLQAGSDFFNWGGLNEKWLCTPNGQWYYLMPDGKLYRWEESVNGPAAAARSVRRSMGSYELSGKFVTAFGKEPGKNVANPFYNDLSLLTASLFHTVQTGNTIVEELARPGGSLWPIDLTDDERRPIVAKRRAMDRLTGTLFAPAVPQNFDWTPDAFRRAGAGHVQSFPDDFDDIVSATLARATENEEVTSDQLQLADQDQQSTAWYAVWDAAKIDPPPRLTCVLVTLTDLAKDNLAYALGRGVLGQPRGRLLQLAAESGVQPASPPSMAPPPFNRADQDRVVAGMPPLRMGGPPVDNMAIDEEGTVTLVRLVGYSVLVGIVLSFLCFRSIKITIMVFIVGGTSAMLSMAVVWWTGGKVDAILMSMPSLVYVLGLSGAIHVINYYRDEVRARGERGAAGRALSHAFLPCTLASFTTAIGLMSLFTSNLAPISNFGFYSAIGVMSTLGILFSYLPAALQTFAPQLRDKQTRDEETPAAPRVESELSQWWAAVGRWITRHHGIVTVACVTLLIVSVFGLRHIRTSVQLLKLFDSESRIIHDYAWLESNFGKLVPMELIVRIPPAVQTENVPTDDANDSADAMREEKGSSRTLSMLQRVEAVSLIRQVVHRTLGGPGMDVVGQATSADTFLPPLPAPSNGYSPIRAKFNRELLAAGDLLRDNDYLRIEKSGHYADSELWRISLRVAALSDVDYGQFIHTLRQTVEPVLRAYETRDELLGQLTIANDGKLNPKSRVLLVGAPRPEPLSSVKVISDDHQTILTRNTYLATLGELIAGERLEKEKTQWLELTVQQAAELRGTERWTKILQSFDAVVWLGEEETLAASDFVDAKSFVDANAIFSKKVTPSLMDDRVPEVIGAGPIQAIYTGVIPVVYKAQRTLLTSLAESIALAFVLIGVVMVLLLNPGLPPFGWLRPRNIANGLAAGAIAMIPNIFPVAMIFGIMCHLRIEIDIGTMMTASVAMGVAVDDTIHFLSWFRENLDRGMSRVDAVIETYRRVGPAMTQTTIVGGLGLFVFALSTFTPTQRFGILMLVMLAAALVGDLVMLPALLAGPLGKFFKPRADVDGKPIKAAQNLGLQPETNTTESSDLVAAVETPLPESKSGGSSPLKVHFPPGERADGPQRIHRN